MDPLDPEKTVANSITVIVTYAMQMLNAEKIWLFGSRARQTAHRHSDIDVAIEAPQADNASWGAFATLIDEQAPTLLHIDLVNFQEIPPTLQHNIRHEGILIYERQHQA